jgi:hypothetical protein
MSGARKWSVSGIRLSNSVRTSKPVVTLNHQVRICRQAAVGLGH